jgi:TonB family protein
MIEFLTYDPKVAALLAVFYMFYRLMLARETFHRVNRVVLLATAVASFVLPLCVITLHKTVVMQSTPNVSFGAFQAVADMSADETGYTALQSAFIALFFVGMAATLGHSLWSLFKIVSLIMKSEKHPQDDGTVICVTGNTAIAPFSWMCFIVMNRSDYLEQNAAILTHERGHIRLHHSWDLLFVDTLTALQWFNPAIWMLRADLRAIHEYEADGAVLSQGINARQYQYLLITKAASIGGYSLANGISHSTLKNRINMMLHTKSPRQRYLKLLALLPIVAVALAVNAETVTDYVYAQPQQQTPVKKGAKAGTIKMGSKSIKVVKADAQSKTDAATAQTSKQRPFDVVEHMPEYPGGASALFEFLSKTVKYPAAAEKAGTQGRVIVTFVVEQDGSIGEPTVTRSVSPELDAEAVRVINAMPNWKPGTQNGKAVRVKYTVPINFALQGGRSNSKIDDKGNPEGKNVLGPLVIVGYDKTSTTELETAPLVILDGKAVDYAQMRAIDTNTISHMEILKDKAATEKYGDKAKNGVILITTKK